MVQIVLKGIDQVLLDIASCLQLCAKDWQLEQRSPVQGLALALANPRRLGLPRLGSTSPLIYVSNGAQEISLWDIENARCHQVCSPPARMHPLMMTMYTNLFGLPGTATPLLSYDSRHHDKAGVDCWKRL